MVKQKTKRCDKLKMSVTDQVLKQWLDGHLEDTGVRYLPKLPKWPFSSKNRDEFRKLAAKWLEEKQNAYKRIQQDIITHRDAALKHEREAQQVAREAQQLKDDFDQYKMSLPDWMTADEKEKFTLRN